MAIVITNGTYYLNCHDGKITKTLNIEEATQYYHVNRAMSNILKRSTQCKGYYLFDTDDKIGRKQVRKHYSQDVRKMLYNQAEGKCALCGKKLVFSEMTLDHIIPLMQNGKDEVENLQVCCYQCNQLKGSILPADLMQKVTEIFLYQMEKKYSKRIWWKSAQYLLRSCIK